jgi:hypothetical protein
VTAGAIVIDVSALICFGLAGRPAARATPRAQRSLPTCGRCLAVRTLWPKATQIWRRFWRVGRGVTEDHDAGRLVESARPVQAPARCDSGLVALQRKIGNKAMQRLFAPRSPATSLKVGDNDDALELEADRAAEQALTAPEPVVALTSAPVQVGKKCAACTDDDKKRLLQRKTDHAAAPGATMAPPKASIKR